MKTLNIGDVTVDRLIESEGPFFDPAFFFPDSNPEAIKDQMDWLKPHFMAPDGGLIGSIHTYIIRTDHHTILVDTCVGNHKTRTLNEMWNNQETPWLDNLKAMGVEPEEVDFVLCTHLHVDHVGWNTKKEDGRWVPTFPNAKYLFHKTEYEAWEKERDSPATDGSFDDSVLPVMEAGKAELVAGDHAIDDRLWLEPSPGHTPGHVCLNLQAGGKKALFTGDALHHPVQVAHPEWNSAFCSIPEQSRATRAGLIDRLADTDVAMLAAHFAAPTVGFVRANGTRCKFAVE